MVDDGAFSHKIDQVTMEILNLRGHPNRKPGSRITAILLNGWILPVGGASAVDGLRSMKLPRLVNTNNWGTSHSGRKLRLTMKPFKILEFRGQNTLHDIRLRAGVLTVAGAKLAVAQL